MASMKRWLSGVVILIVGLSPAAARAQTSPSPLADDPTLIALAVALSCADAPEAVEAPPQGPSGPAAAGPEIELVATVRAKTLKFDEVPKVDVVFQGNGKRKTVWKTERVNLPMHPQPGVVYHDVQVRLTISSDVEELTSMLREAKRASRGIRIEDAVAAAPAAARPADPPKSAQPTAVPAAPAVKQAPAAPAAAPAPAAPAAPKASAAPTHAGPTSTAAPISTAHAIPTATSTPTTTTSTSTSTSTSTKPSATTAPSPNGGSPPPASSATRNPAAPAAQ